MFREIGISDEVYTELTIRYGSDDNFSSHIARLLRLEDEVRSKVRQYDKWLDAVKKELNHV